jgi:hypothetical protein
VGTFKKIADLGPFGYGCAEHSRLEIWGLDFHLYYLFRTEEKDENLGCIVFRHGLAYRWTRNYLCPIELQEAFNNLSEYTESDWVKNAWKQLNTPGSEYHIEFEELHHYVVYFDGGPCYEVLAASATMSPLPNA